MNFFENFQYLFLTIAYLLVGVIISNYEYNKFKQKGFVCVHVLMAFYLIYIIFPSIIIYFLLWMDGNISTSVFFFDKIIGKIDFTQSITIFILNLIFLISFYISNLGLSTDVSKNLKVTHKMHCKEFSLWIFVCLAFAICATFFTGLGESFTERYINLHLFRALQLEDERNFFTSNAFSITEIFSWLCAALIFYYYVNKKMWGTLFAVLFCLFFAFLQGSRRAYIFPVLIIYFCNAFYFNRLHLRFLALFMPLAIAWIAIGEEFMGSFVYSSDQYSFDDVYSSKLSALMRAACEVGIGQIQSHGVLQYFDWSFRLGVDHILSVLRRLPEQSLGFGDIFPERITRITTTLFMSHDHADIPPGMIGATWLDFPFLGAIGWGGSAGYICLVVDRMRKRYFMNPALAMLLSLAMIIVAMPINTGSFDFTFDVKIPLLVAMLWYSIRKRKFTVADS
jgi:hypothetical protein